MDANNRTSQYQFIALALLLAMMPAAHVSEVLLKKLRRPASFRKLRECCFFIRSKIRFRFSKNTVPALSNNLGTPSATGGSARRFISTIGSNNNNRRPSRQSSRARVPPRKTTKEDSLTAVLMVLVFTKKKKKTLAHGKSHGKSKRFEGFSFSGFQTPGPSNGSTPQGNRAIPHRQGGRNRRTPIAAKRSLAASATSRVDISQAVDARPMPSRPGRAP